MTHKLIVKPLAEKEIAEALLWYEKQKKGLAIELLNEINSVFGIIISNPENFQERYKEIRIVFTKRFPYGIHYTLENNTIYVHAVFHMKRKPRM